MIYIVQFSDGSTGQVQASNDIAARQLAVSKWKDKVVVNVKKAGLLGMTQRHPGRPAGRG